MVDLSEALAELLATRETLSKQLLRKETLFSVAASRNAQHAAHDQATYESVIIDTLDALDRIDQAIDILENQSGDVLTRAILCLKTRPTPRKPNLSAQTLH